MNEIKHELKQVLESEKRFDERNIKNVFNQMEQKKSKHIGLKLSFATVIIAAFSIFAIVLSTKDQPSTSSTPLAASTLQEAVELKVAPDEYTFILADEDIIQKGDAIVVYTLTSDPSILVTTYFVKENEGWVEKETIPMKMSNPDSQWTNLNNIYVGYYYDHVGSYYDSNKLSFVERNVGNVLVGDESAGTIAHKEDGINFWYAINNEANAPVMLNFSDGSFQRISKSGIDQFEDYSFVPTASINDVTKNKILEYKKDNMDRGDSHYTKYPLIVTDDLGELNRGDVVTYVNSDGETVISRIMALPNETFSVDNGTVLLNGSLYDSELGFAKVSGETTLKGYKKVWIKTDKGYKKLWTMNDIERVQEIFKLDMDQVKLKSNEYVVVPDNWLNGEIEVINDNQITGKVLGYNPLAMNSEWTKPETQLYEQFKSDYDVRVFKNVDPITIARVYFYASFLNDPVTEYHLYTQNEGYVQWSLAEHIENHEVTTKNNPTYYIQMASWLKEGQFIETDTGGYIKFGKVESPLGFQMVQNEEGIWQISFMPIQ